METWRKSPANTLSQDMAEDVGLMEKLYLRVKSTHLQFEIGLKFEIRDHVFCARW